MMKTRIQNNQCAPEHCSILCIVPFAALCSKNVTTYPPLTHTFLKQPFLTDFKKCTHPPPPPGTKFWCIGRPRH